MEQPAGIVPDDGGQDFRCLVADFGQFHEHGPDKGRFVALDLVAIRGRGKVGRIGFNQQPVVGYMVDQCPRVLMVTTPVMPI